MRERSSLAIRRVHTTVQPVLVVSYSKPSGGELAILRYLYLCSLGAAVMTRFYNHVLKSLSRGRLFMYFVLTGK